MYRLLSIALFFLSPVILFATNYQIISFDKLDYKGSSQNWSVAFDSNGFAYIGNNTGLLEFDGVTWRNYSAPNGITIRAVAVDNQNNIYTCGYRELGFWNKNKNGKLIYHSLSSLIEEEFSLNEEFWNIQILNDSVIFQSFSAIYFYYNGKFTSIRSDYFLNYMSISHKKIYFSLQDKGVYAVKKNSFYPIIESNWFKNKTIVYIEKTNQNGNYLIFTESQGMFVYDSINQNFSNWPDTKKINFSDSKINKVLKISKNRYIIGTLLNGVSLLNNKGELILCINQQDGLQGNTVLGLGLDSYQNIWVTQNKGIDLITITKNPAVQLFNNLHCGAVHTAAKFHDEIYLGTNQGLYKRKSNDTNAPFVLIPNTQEHVLECKIVDDKLFVGHNSGTFLIDGKAIKKISNATGGHSIIRNPLNTEQLIQSTYTELVVYKKNDKQWRYSHTLKGINNIFRFIEFDHLHNLWCSHIYQGIYRIKLNASLDSIENIKYYGKNSIFGENGKRANVFKIENRIVFATGQGFYTYDDLNDTIVEYDFLNKNLGYYKNAVRVVPTIDNKYWFISDSGVALFKITPQTVQLIKDFPVSLFQNKLIPLRENIVPIEEEKAIVCLEDGYAIIDASITDSTNLLNLTLPELREIEISDKYQHVSKPISHKTKYIIPYSKNNLHLEFSFPLLSASMLHFQYKIDGLNETWSKYSEKPVFDINRIPTGNYILNVRAKNNWGEYSNISSIPLVVKPPWFRSVVAIIIYILLFIGVTTWMRYISVRKVKLKEVQKRREKEKELIQLRNDKLRSELKFKSQQLASSTIGIIKKNEFLLLLKEKITRQKHELGIRYPDKYYKYLIDKIDGHIAGQDDWKVFESNFEQAHEAFLLNLKNKFPNLTSSDLKLCAYLRINLTSKEIAPLLGITIRGVENHRYRLRKKLHISAEQSLNDFILSFQP